MYIELINYNLNYRAPIIKDIAANKHYKNGEKWILININKHNDNLKREKLQLYSNQIVHWNDTNFRLHLTFWVGQAFLMSRVSVSVNLSLPGLAASHFATILKKGKWFTHNILRSVTLTEIC